MNESQKPLKYDKQRTTTYPESMNTARNESDGMGSSTYNEEAPRTFDSVKSPQTYATTVINNSGLTMLPLSDRNDSPRKHPKRFDILKGGNAQQLKKISQAKQMLKSNGNLNGLNSARINGPMSDRKLKLGNTGTFQIPAD